MECKIPATHLGENTEHGLPAGICVHIKPEEAVDCSQQHIDSVVVKEEPKHEAEEPIPEPISQENVVILTSGYEITIKDELPDKQPLDIVVQEEPVPEEPASSGLRCDKCNKQFTIARSYRVHCQRHRDIESERYLCKPCRRPFGTLHDLTRHERKVHGAIGDDPEATFQESEAIATSGFEVTVKEEPSDEPGATVEQPLTVAVKKEPAPEEEEEESKPQQRAALRCGRCKKHFNSAGSYKMHCQRHRNIERRRFVCKPCRKPFGALRDLTRHERHTHGVVQGQVQQRVYRCKFKFCEKAFDSVETFQEHVQAHRNVQKRLFACEKCGKCFVNRSSLKRHVQLNVCETMPRALEEDGGIFKCSTCGKTFSQRYLIDQHIRRHLARTDFREKTLDLTEKHTAEAGSEPIDVQRNREECFKCPLCSKLFRQRYPCVRHIRRHIERARGTFQCETCGLYLGNNKELIQHEVDKHGKIKPEPEEPLQVDEKGQFKCTECTKTFTQRRLVLRHLRRHKALSEGAFQCKICGKFFAANAELLHHSIEKHNEAQKVPKVDPLEKDADGRFKCTQCEQTFALRAQCSAHIRRHKIKDSGQYRCKKCSKCFVRPKDLENHERAATSLTKSLCSKNRESLKIDAEKLAKTSDKGHHVIEENGTFVCSSCSKVFLQRRFCVAHVRRHFDLEKGRFRCETCGLNLGTNKELRRHAASRHGTSAGVEKKPLVPIEVEQNENGWFKCPECPESFRNRITCTKHMKRHEHVRNGTFQCGFELCGLRFGSNFELKRHVLVHSNNQPAEPESASTSTAQTVAVSEVKSEIIIPDDN